MFVAHENGVRGKQTGLGWSRLGCSLPKAWTEVRTRCLTFVFDWNKEPETEGWHLSLSETNVLQRSFWLTETGRITFNMSKGEEISRQEVSPWVKYVTIKMQMWQLYFSVFGMFLIKRVPFVSFICAYMHVWEIISGLTADANFDSVWIWTSFWVGCAGQIGQHSVINHLKSLITLYLK